MDVMEKLNQEVTVKMPAKFVSAIVKALEDGAIIHIAELQDDEDLTEQSKAYHASILTCYREVHRVFSKINDELFTKDEVRELSETANATLDSIAEAKEARIN